jgi:uncharacterized protein YutE (UPF0331/DUF86 family)
VARLLRSVTDAVATLEGEQSAQADRRSDPLWLPGIKYLMIAAVEASIDVAQHLCSTEGWGPPRDNGDAMILLGEHTVVTPLIAESMRQAVGFRNVLVHEYVEVDDGIVLARLADLRDLRTFTASVAGWLQHGP